MKNFFIILITVFFVGGCTAGKQSISPAYKYPPGQLKKDFVIFRQLLEDHHPGLYWHSSQERINFYFEQAQQQLKDSMTEAQFRTLLSYVASKINCGHTTIRPSEKWNRWYDTAAIQKIFPLSMKLWNDSMVVTASLNRKDSVLSRGTIITAINNISAKTIADSLFGFISADGNNRTHKYQVLSNRGSFGTWYTQVFGFPDRFDIEYINDKGRPASRLISAYRPAADTAGKEGTRRFRPAQQQPSPKKQRELRWNSVRLLRIDTVNRTAMMTLATFSKGYRLKHFFKNSFNTLQQHQVNHLIIDVRNNGGGSVSNSTRLTRYLVRKKFKLADSLYAIRTGSRYQRYIKNHFWNKLFIRFFTRRRSNGNYHFGYFERHFFSPKKKNHFDGKVYILTGGNSFSATTLFAAALIRQENVTVVGEETGGGAIGNSAWLIPDVHLPETGVRFRLPLFRLVMDRNFPANSGGIQPEILVVPTVEYIRQNTDYKTVKAMELIGKEQAAQSNH